MTRLPSTGYQWITWAKNQTGVSRRAKTVLMALATYADGEGRCFPLMTRLAADLGCGEQTISRGMTELIESGLVERTRIRRDGSLRGYDFCLRAESLPVNLTGSSTRQSDQNLPVNLTGQEERTTKEITTSEHELVAPHVVALSLQAGRQALKKHRHTKHSETPSHGGSH